MYKGLEQPGDRGLSQASSDFLNVTSGISAILAPIAQVGVSIYQTQQLQKLEKARMKAEAAAQSAMAMMPQQGPVIVQSGSGLLIGVIAGGAVLLGLLVFLLTRKGSGDSAGTVVSSTSGATPSEAPRRIKRIKRVSRPKHSY